MPTQFKALRGTTATVLVDGLALTEAQVQQAQALFEQRRREAQEDVAVVEFSDEFALRVSLATIDEALGARTPKHTHLYLWSGGGASTHPLSGDTLVLTRDVLFERVLERR